MIEEAFTRAAGTPLVIGEVPLLRDAGENYPAWLEAIAAAQRTIHFESYIIYDDEAGILRPRPAGSQTAVCRGGVQRRDWNGLLTGGGSSAQVG